MTFSARIAAATFALTLLGGGAAFAADAMCACCDKMKAGEPMACCDKMKKDAAPTDGQSPAPAPTGHEGHAGHEVPNGA
jgi:pentapeptide MXKDX repeat protein